MKRIFVMGHYGGANIGDEAMLLGLVSELRSRDFDNIGVISKTGGLPFDALPVRPGDVAHPGAKSVMKAVFNSDLVVLGGGTHFHDDYRARRYARHFRYMFRIVAVTAVARFLHKPVYWLGMGFGPFIRKSAGWMTRLGLHFVSGVSVRDSISAEYARRLGFRGPLVDAFDLAALIPAVQSHRRVADRSWVGVSVASVSEIRGRDNELDEKLLDALAEALREGLARVPEVGLKLFVFRGGDREDDKAMTIGLRSRLGEGFCERVTLVDYQSNPVYTLEELATCRSFIATRYHSAVLSFLAGCNLLLLSYHEKVARLRDQLGLESEACLDIRKLTSVDDVKRSVRGLLRCDRGYVPKLSTEEAVHLAKRNLDFCSFDDIGIAGRSQ